MSKIKTLKEIFIFMWKRKMLWMAPLILILVLLGALIIFTEGSALAPFIYTLF